MALARKCDRCGRLFEPVREVNGYKDAFVEIRVVVCNYNKTIKRIGEYDLCEDCNHSFNEWVTEVHLESE